MIILALFVSFLSGHFILRLFRPLGPKDIFLIPGVGLGFSAQIVFYSLLIFNRIIPSAIIEFHLVCLLILFFYTHYSSKRYPVVLGTPAPWAVMAILLTGVGLWAGVLSWLRPYGDWDGWSYWNFHANFLWRSDHHWQRVFEFGMQARHPWMLPCMILWGWSCLGSESHFVPMVIALTFTLSCIGLLVFALKEYTPFSWALLAGVFLFSIPFYLLFGTSQYADILLAYFILAATVSIIDLFKNFDARGSFLVGLFLGFVACSKDNGIPAAVLLLVLVVHHLWKVVSLKGLIRPLMWGMMSIMVSVFLMKSFDALDSYCHSYDISWVSLWHIQRWSLIGHFLIHSFINQRWGMLWPLAIFVPFLFKKQLDQEKGIKLIVKFLILYFILYLFFYVVSILELNWLLTVAFDRLLFLLVPTIIFVCFILLSPKEPVK